jgi:putative flippase GtrA
MADRRAHLVSLVKFGFVGGVTVLIDAAAYSLLVWLGVQLDLAKALGFVIGAVFAYFVNWRFTFGRRRSRWSELIFVAVYLAALGINVGINALVVAWLPTGWPLALPLAFVLATGVSAAWNFVGMSLFVFGHREPADSGTPAPTREGGDDVV